MITSNQIINDFSASSTIANQNCDGTTSRFEQNHSGNFSKVVIYKLTNNNALTSVNFQVQISATESGSYGTHEEVIVNNPSYNNSKIELNLTSGFAAGEWYQLRLIGLPWGTVGCDWGTDAAGNLAGAWYESVSKTYNPALSIDSGATVVVQ